MSTLDFSKPELLQTRDGRAVRIYATDVGCIHGAVFTNGRWFLREWLSNGKFTKSENDDLCDIVAKPPRVTGWANAYPNSTRLTLFSTKEEAMSRAAKDCLGQIYIDAEIRS